MPGSKSLHEVAYNMESKPFGEVAGCIKEKKNERIGSRSAHVVNFSGPMPALSWPQGDKLMPNLLPPYSRRFFHPICTREAEDSGKSLEFASQCGRMRGNSQTSPLGNLGEQEQLQGAHNGRTTQNMEFNVSSDGGQTVQDFSQRSNVQEIWRQILVDSGLSFEETLENILREPSRESFNTFSRILKANGVVDTAGYRKFLDHSRREGITRIRTASSEFFTELFDKYDRFRQEHCDPVIDELLSSV